MWWAGITLPAPSLRWPVSMMWAISTHFGDAAVFQLCANAHRICHVLSPQLLVPDNRAKRRQNRRRARRVPGTPAGRQRITALQPVVD